MWVNILKSIDEGPFQMGTFQETLAEGNEGDLHLGPERARVYSDLSPEDKERYNAAIRATNILLQGLPKYIYTLINHYTDAKDIFDNVKMLREGFELTKEERESQLVDRIEAKGTMQGVQVQLVMGELKTELGMQIQVKKGGQDNAIDEDVNEQPLQDLALNVDNVFQADNCDAFDSDVDEAPTAQTCSCKISHPQILFMMKPDAVCEHHEVHEMHDDVQPNYVIDSHANYTSDSNMILYDQYVKDNAVSIVQSNVSCVPNYAYMMILNDIYEPSAQCVSVTTQNNVVDNSMTAELATYKEQVESYERRAKFELTERQQNINEQLRIVIADRNRKEESLKRELHSVKLKLTSTINHNKSTVEEVTSLKNDFK
ncbi:hypothetical protein Tco_0375753 [Tanacetum coccineum]